MLFMAEILTQKYGQKVVNVALFSTIIVRYFFLPFCFGVSCNVSKRFFTLPVVVVRFISTRGTRPTLSYGYLLASSVM